MSPLIVSASAQHERGPHTEDFSAALVELCRKSVKPQKRWADPHIVPRLPPLWHPARLLHTPRAVPPVGGPGVSAPALPTNCCSPRGAPCAHTVANTNRPAPDIPEAAETGRIATGRANRYSMAGS